MDIHTHIKQGILHFLQVTGKHPHVQALFPEPQLSEKDLLDILQKEAYHRLSKESRFFFTTISVFSCGNYSLVNPLPFPDKSEVIVSVPAPDPIKTQVKAIDESIEDMLNEAMPK